MSPVATHRAWALSEAVTLFGVDVMHDNHIPNVDPVSQIKLKALRVKYAD